MKEIIGYKCDFCGKIYRYKGTALNHEKVCKDNPKNNAACIGCKYIDEVKILVRNWQWSGDPNDWTPQFINSKKFNCNKLDKDLYPALILRKRLHKRHPEHFAKQEQMPSECKFNMPIYLGNGNADYFTFKYYNNE